MPKAAKPSCSICVHRSFCSSSDGTFIACSEVDRQPADVANTYTYSKFSRAAEACAHYEQRAKRTEYEDMLESQLIYNNIRYSREFVFDGRGKTAWDFAIPDARLLVEVNGNIWQKGGHSSGTGIMRDYKKLMMAQMNGWAEFMVASQHVADGTALQWIIEYGKRNK